MRDELRAQAAMRDIEGRVQDPVDDLDDQIAAKAVPRLFRRGDPTRDAAIDALLA